MTEAIKPPVAEIRLTVSSADILKCKNSEHAEMMILSRLKKAGVKIKGTFFFNGLTDGFLEWHQDFKEDLHFRYCHEPEQLLKPIAKPGASG